MTRSAVDLQAAWKVTLRSLRDRIRRRMPGRFEVLELIDARGLPKGVATSSQRDYLEEIFARFDLLPRFSVALTAESVTHGKPHPEIYLKAAERLGMAPERCLAIEDAPKGVQSAARAGMAVVAVDTPYTAGLAIPEADARISGLDRFALHWLDAAA